MISLLHMIKDPTEGDSPVINQQDNLVLRHVHTLEEDLNDGLPLNISASDLNNPYSTAFGYTFEQKNDFCDEENNTEGKECLEDQDELAQAESLNLKKFSEDFILDSIAVQFHGNVFLIQFFCHLFFPLAYLLVNYEAQGFKIRSNFLTHVPTWFNIIFPSIVYLMIIMYFLCPKQDTELITGALWIPVIFFLQHRLIIGLKYASLSPTEYTKFQASDSEEKAAMYMKQMQLLTGWSNRDDSLLRFELGCAAARIGAKINEISITIADPSESELSRNEFACWNALLKGENIVRLNSRPAKELTRHSDGRYTVSVYDLSKAIIRKADFSSPKGGYWLIFIFVAMMIMVPWIGLIRSATSFTRRSTVLYVFLGCNFFSLMLFGTIALILLYVSVWDVSRQLRMVSYLNRLIRITDLTLDDSISFRRGPCTNRRMEQQREKLSVILSVTRPERRKSVAIRKSQFSGKTYSLMEPSSLKGRSFKSPVSSSKNSGNNVPLGGGIYSGDIKSRFTDYGSNSVKDEDRSHIPQISFKTAENIMGWTYTRLVFQHFGERFRNRVDAYTGATMLLMLGLMGAELLIVVIDPNPMESFNSVFFKQSLLAVVLMWLFLLVCATLGALVNNQLNLHSRTFAAHKLRIRDEIFILSALNEDNDDEIAKLTEALEVLDNCKDVVETYAELKPFSVFGFKVESSTVFTIFSGGVSLFGVLFSLYSSASSQQQ